MANTIMIAETSGLREMSENKLADELSTKMKRQMELRSRISGTYERSEIDAAIKRQRTLLGQERLREEPRLRINQLHEPIDTAIVQLFRLENECIELMEQYFRDNVYPMIAKRFPGKIGPDKCVAQFTQLLHDFFIEIKQRFDDQMWIETSPAELRRYASTAISRDVLSLLRRNKTGREAASVHALKLTIAKDAERRMAEDQLDLEQVLAILERWDESGTNEQRKFAQVIRLYYVLELTDDEVDHDAALTPQKGLTLKEIATNIGAPLATVAGWRRRAVAALRKEIDTTL